MSYKVGDKVKIVAENSGCYLKYIGKVTTITEVDDDHYHLEEIPHGCGWWGESELELVTKGKRMGKLYRVVKDHPVWEVGAILQEDGDDGYEAMNDLFVKEIEGLNSYSETAAVVENSDFFERVYEVSLLKKAKALYLNKAEARKAHEDLYKSK